MKLKLDENLGLRCIEALRAASHDVATVWDQGLAGAPDPQVIEVCRHENRCLVTLDLDFANPLRYPPGGYAGIAVLRLPPRPGPGDLMEAVSVLIRGLEQDTMTGKLWIVQRGAIREYQPER